MTLTSGNKTMKQKKGVHYSVNTFFSGYKIEKLNSE